MRNSISETRNLLDREGIPWGAPALLSLCVIPFGWAGLLAPVIWFVLVGLEVSKGWRRFTLYFIAVISMLVAASNIIPGSNRLHVLPPYSDSSGNLIYAGFNVGKAIVSIAILAFMLRLRQTIRISDLRYLLLAIIIPVITGMFLYGPSIKLSWVIFFAALINLIIICVSEEGFFRWILQRGLEEGLGRLRWISVPIIATLFVLLHTGWSANSAAVLLLGIASLCYAILWYMFRNFWICVLAHWGVNFLHMLTLPYPLPG
ncbi:CPBP family intramembrane glutamic endopeptidase [Microbulbifer sp. VTAC004]|uniref:lysostaphin resistance A-like protein n=1 Tax=Microbulbifer sp. VTAC004 TaxID=3243386 RepID=UPI00403A1133